VLADKNDPSPETVSDRDEVIDSIKNEVIRNKVTELAHKNDPSPICAAT